MSDTCQTPGCGHPRSQHATLTRTSRCLTRTCQCGIFNGLADGVHNEHCDCRDCSQTEQRIAEEHDRMGHMTSDKRKRWSEKNAPADPPADDRETLLAANIVAGNKLASLRSDLQAAETERDNWKRIAMMAGVTETDKGHVLIPDNDGLTKPRHWWWPW